MKQSIIGYHKDDDKYWVAELACGHFQHVRHKPPWVNRRWITTEKGRMSKIGYQLECKKCDTGEPSD